METNKPQSENTALISGLTYDGKELGQITKFPRRVLFIMDISKNNGQITIFNDEDINIFENQDIGVFRFSVTDDPYCDYTARIINLGYSGIKMRLCSGSLITTKPLTYITNDLNDGHIVTSLPLRSVTEFDGNCRGVEFLQKKENTYQVVDYNFGEDINKPVIVVYSEFNYKNKKGNTKVFRVDMRSYFNKVKVLKEENYNTKKELNKIHGLKIEKKQIKKRILK